MSNITDFKEECSLRANVSCWTRELEKFNRQFAELMVPVEILMVILMVMGIFGNALVLIVYINRRNRTTAHIFIMYLASIDLMACAVIHPYVIYKLFNNYSQTWVVACKIFEFIVHANLGLSALTLLAIAVDRFFAICRPVKFLNFHKHIYKVISATFILGIVISLPLFEFYGANPDRIVLQDFVFVGYKCDFSEKYQGTTAMTAFSVFITSGFLTQFVAMAILYKHVAVVAYRSRRTVVPVQAVQESDISGRIPATTSSMISDNSRKLTVCSVSPLWSSDQTLEQQKLQVASKEDSSRRYLAPENNATFTASRTTTMTSFTSLNEDHRHVNINSSNNLSSSLKAAKMLFLVTAVFLISWLPFFIIRIYATVNPQNWNDLSSSRKVAEHFLCHCFYINNAVNPVIYSVINKNFRKECLSLLKRHCAC